MNKKIPLRAENIRRALAQEAARIMSEHGVRDFLFAKRKAAERFGVVDGAALPKNTEIEAALVEYQRLFQADTHVESLYAQRMVALEAMRLLDAFQPRLVGPVLLGTATEHDEVQLHVFSERAENVTFALLDRGVEYEVAERRIKISSDRVLAQPAVRFEMDAQPVEAIVFEVDGIRQAPVSPVDGKPLRRAARAEVEALLT